MIIFLFTFFPFFGLLSVEPLASGALLTAAACCGGHGDGCVPNAAVPSTSKAAGPAAAVTSAPVLATQFSSPPVCQRVGGCNVNAAA